MLRVFVLVEMNFNKLFFALAIIFLSLNVLAIESPSCDSVYCCTGDCGEYTNVTTCQGAASTDFIPTQTGCYTLTQSCVSSCYLRPSGCGSVPPGEVPAGCSSYTCPFGISSSTIVLQAGVNFPLLTVLSRSGDPACLIASVCTRNTNISFLRASSDNLCSSNADCSSIGAGSQLCENDEYYRHDLMKNGSTWIWSCEGYCGSNAINNCSLDCPECGDGTCNGAEDKCSCPSDCGMPAPCECSTCNNDNVCDGWEICGECCSDCCSPPEPVCGNEVCEEGETCCGCSPDCGACEAGICGLAAKTYYDTNAFPDGSYCEKGVLSTEGVTSPVAATCPVGSTMQITPDVNAVWVCAYTNPDGCIVDSAPCIATRKKSPNPPECGSSGWSNDCDSGVVIWSNYIPASSMSCYEHFSWGCGSDDCQSDAVYCNLSKLVDPCPPFCGDGSCNADENCSTCVVDCNICPPVCGNLQCELDENCSSCFIDCGECRVCGDGKCVSGEDPLTCCIDCPSTAACCGNGICESMLGETWGICPGDCPSICGNGTCDSYAGENSLNCCKDCLGMPGQACCGDGVCENDKGEICGSCVEDCGVCPKCIGSFAHASLFLYDDVGVLSDTSSVLVNDKNNTDRKCEWYCDENYFKVSLGEVDICVPLQGYICTPPNDSHALAYPGDEDQPILSNEQQGIFSYKDNERQCEYYCDVNYRISDDEERCILRNPNVAVCGSSNRAFSREELFSPIPSLLCKEGELFNLYSLPIEQMELGDFDGAWVKWKCTARDLNVECIATRVFSELIDVNAILDLNASYFDKKLSLNIRCSRNTFADLKLFDYNGNEIALSSAIKIPCRTNFTSIELVSSVPLIVGDTYSISASIKATSPDCSVCSKTAFVNISESKTSVPDNSLILLIMILFICVFIIKRKSF